MDNAINFGRIFLPYLLLASSRKDTPKIREASTDVNSLDKKAPIDKADILHGCLLDMTSARRPIRNINLPESSCGGPKRT